MKQNSSLNGGLNLSLLQNTTTLNLKGKQCLVIPLDDNPSLFIGKKGVYLDICVVETPDSKFGHTHYVRADIGAAKRSGLSKDDIKALTPILGNLKPIEAKRDTEDAPETGTTEDLPW